jgi:excisionase family DNA binding protein
MPTDLLNVRQTAEVLGVHENTVRNWEKSGLLRGVKLPGSGFRRFPREEVERMRREVMGSYAPATELPDTTTGVTGTVVHGDVL